MHRNLKSGVYSNNSIRFNRMSNKKTKNIGYIENEEYKIKINCNKLYNICVSNKENKILNHRNKYYKMNNEEDIIDD
jgi:hypothetical protein